MRNTILILIFLPAFAAAQNVGQFGYVYAKDSLRLKAIVDSISRDTNISAASYRKLPTTKVVKSYADYHIASRPASITAPSSGQVIKWNGSAWAPDSDNTSTGASGHVLANTGTAVTQRDTANFVDTGDINFTLTDAATKTNISGDLNTNVVDSTNIINGGVSVLDLGQHGASSGQVLKWNGTQWAPGTDNGVTGTGTNTYITYWTGTSTISGEAALTYNATTDAVSIGASTPVSISNSGFTIGRAYQIGGSSSTLTIGGSSGALTATTSSNSGFLITTSGSGTNSGVRIGTSTTQTATGANRRSLTLGESYAPTSSGTGVLKGLYVGGTINQTGGHTGDTWGIHVDPTLTAVGGTYYGLDISANSARAKGVYQSGSSTTNNFAGSTRFGSTSAPARTLDVTGEARISDLTTDNPTRIVGADADGDLGALKLGTGLSISNDTLNASAGTVTGTGAAGQVTYWSGASTITGENAFNYDATNNRLGVNKTSPAVTVDIQTANSTDGLRIQSDGTVDQDVWGVELAGVATGPYTQRGRISLDVFSNAGASPDGESMVFTLTRDAGNTYTPLLLYRDQAVMNNSAGFAIANNSGRLRFQASSAGIFNTDNNWLLTSSSFTTNDANTRLKLVGSTQTSSSWSFRAFDGNAQSIFQIRDDSRVGITATTLDASLTINGAGATSGTYGLIVTPSGGTTTTGTLIVRDDNRVGVRTNAPQTPLNVVGTGTTSGSTAFLVEGSGGQDNFKTRDDGVNIGQGFAMESNAPTIAFGLASGTGPTNDLCQGGANGFILFFTTGTSPTTNSAIFTATLPKFYPNGVVATWSCGDTDCLDEAPDIYISGTGNNSVTLSTRSTLTASTAYVVYVTCFGY